MDYDFLERIQPHILNIADRNMMFWMSRFEDSHTYKVIREKTETHSLALIYSGEGVLELGGNTYRLTKNSLFYCPAGARMVIEWNKDQTLQYYSVLFKYELSAGEESDSAKRTGAVEPLAIPPVMDGNEMPTLLECYVTSLSMWQEKNAGYRWYTKMQFMKLLDLVAKLHREHSQQKRRNALLADLAVAYMKEHLHEEFDRSRLAAHLSVSPGHLSRLFKQHLGCSPIEFVVRLRVDQAKHMLHSTRLSVRAISESLGFTDPYYFSRVFSKATGMSPREFRKL
ncbi:MAG: transcriptional regulator [Paenibacillus sp.]|jgi:AraC-like DNA-binding protein|nr:transcriptional regulator [Paenibacillus sp.]